MAQTSGEEAAWESAWKVFAPVTDLVTPMAVRVAATLRLTDPIGGDRVPAEEPARRSGAHADAPTRLLRHLAHQGVYTECGRRLSPRLRAGWTAPRLRAGLDR